VAPDKAGRCIVPGTAVYTGQGGDPGAMAASLVVFSIHGQPKHLSTSIANSQDVFTNMLELS
jgi:hypothetical protein